MRELIEELGQHLNEGVFDGYLKHRNKAVAAMANEMIGQFRPGYSNEISDQYVKLWDEAVAAAGDEKSIKRAFFRKSVSRSLELPFVKYLKPGERYPTGEQLKKAATDEFARREKKRRAEVKARTPEWKPQDPSKKLRSYRAPSRSSD